MAVIEANEANETEHKRPELIDTVAEKDKYRTPSIREVSFFTRRGAFGNFSSFGNF